MPVSLAEATEIFIPMEAQIRSHVWTDSDLFAMAGNLCLSNPHVAYAFTTEISILLQEETELQISYTDIAVRAYFNTLFDIEKATAYGTGYLLSNPAALRQFVAGFRLNEEEPEPIQTKSLLILPSHLLQ